MKYTEARKLFEEYVRSYCAPDSITYYKLNLDFFERYLVDCFGTLDFSILELKKTHFIGYINCCREKGIKNVSVRTYCRAVKVFLRYLYTEGYILENITLNVKFPRTDKRPIIPLTVRDVEIIYSGMKNDSFGIRNKAIFALMLDCGLRLSEVISLNIENVDLKNNCVIVVNSKNNKNRIVPLPVKVCAYIKDYMNTRNSSERALFLDRFYKDRISHNAIKLIFQKLKKYHRDLYPHLLRHTFATSYIMGGGQIEILRVLMGHEDYTITKDYLHLATQLGVIHHDIYKLDGCIFSTYIAYTPTH